MDKIKDYLATIGSRGGKAGTGDSKRRDQKDPDYYKRISKKAAEARKAKRLGRELGAEQA
jgi:hypothetical protein